MILYALVQRLGAKGVLYFIGISFVFWAGVVPIALISMQLEVQRHQNLYDKAVAGIDFSKPVTDADLAAPKINPKRPDWEAIAKGSAHPKNPGCKPHPKCLEI
jgi:hypothetical protein